MGKEAVSSSKSPAKSSSSSNSLTKKPFKGDKTTSSSTNGDSTQSSKKKKRMPKHKRKKQGNKEKDPLLSKVENKRSRNFADDLREYLSQWKESRDTTSENTTVDRSAWKFNKVLQQWALDNCFQKKKIDAVLFKSLLPYILTIKGGSLIRLGEDAQDILDGKTVKKRAGANDEEEQGEGEKDGEENIDNQDTKDPEKESKSARTRAQVIKQLLDEIEY